MTKPLRACYEKYKDIDQKKLGEFERKVMLMDVWDVVKDYCDEEEI